MWGDGGRHNGGRDDEDRGGDDRGGGDGDGEYHNGEWSDDAPDARRGDAELRGYEPYESKRGLTRSRLLRIVVIVAVAALVLPGFLSTLTVAQRTANIACERYVSVLQPDAESFSARFELVGPDGSGWQCYAVTSSGVDAFLMNLGLIPSGPVLRAPGQAV